MIADAYSDELRHDQLLVVAIVAIAALLWLAVRLRRAWLDSDVYARRQGNLRRKRSDQHAERWQRAIIRLDEQGHLFTARVPSGQTLRCHQEPSTRYIKIERES